MSRRYLSPVLRRQIETYLSVVRREAATVHPLSYYGRNQPPPPRPGTPKAELRAAFLRYAKRRTARDRELLVREHLCWAFDMAARAKGPRLDIDDAVSAANAGLMEAIEGFDPTRGFAFTTYASFIIRRHLIEAAVQTYPVKVTDHQRRLWREQAEKNARRMSELPEGEPTTVQEFFDRVRAIPVDDAEGDERGRGTPEEMKEFVDPATAMILAELPESVRQAVQRLPRLERRLIAAVFLRDESPSFEELARRFHIRKSRVRELYEQAIAHLRTDLSKE